MRATGTRRPVRPRLGFFFFSPSMATSPKTPPLLSPLSSFQIPPAPPLVLVISGPSGVGKDAALAALIAARPPGSLRTVVTATTRAMRPGEVDGVDYQFVSQATFRGWLAEGSLLEHAVVYGEYKGIPRSALEGALAAGSDVALRVDVQGAAALRSLLPGAVRIFLAAESEAALVRRLTARKTEPVDALATRVGTARREVGEAGEFDYGEKKMERREKRKTQKNLTRFGARAHAGGQKISLVLFPTLTLTRSRRQPGGRPGGHGRRAERHHRRGKVPGGPAAGGWGRVR